MQIGTISNYDGHLEVYESGGKYYWYMDDYDIAEDHEEIPKYLYDALVKFETERDKGE